MQFLKDFNVNKLLFISTLTLFIVIINSYSLKSQIIDNEQAPSNVKWRQINHKKFQLIFPVEFEKSASLLAHQIDGMIENSSQDLKRVPKKISIILHEKHIEQNGFAQLAPRKVEAFSTPGPASDNTEWLPNLVQHELRHVAQFDKLTGKIQGPFFQQLAFALYGLHLPAWYFEGDAVSIETQFSTGGRGRSSAWIMPLRTNELSGKEYTFSKNILGSFKDITPSYYTTGYTMNTYLTNHFGYGVKEEIMDNMRANLLRPFNFNIALKKYTNMNSSKLYKATMDSLKSEWKSTEVKSEFQPIIEEKERYYTNYFLPQTNSSKSIFTMIQSPEFISEIRKIKDGKHETLVKIGYQLTPYFHVNDNFLVWDEIRKNARFGKQTFNIIRILDLKNGKISTLSKNSRFYSPILSPNSQKVYVVHVDENNVSSLLYIDRLTKETKKIVEFEDGILLQQPNINAQETKIVGIGIGPKGTNILEIDLTSGAASPLFPWSNQEYQRPIYLGNDLVFKAQFEKIDNIYRYSFDEKKIYKISNSAFGAFYPSPGNDQNLLYNEYVYNGYKASILDSAQVIGTEISPKFEVQPLLDSRVEPWIPTDKDLNNSEFEVKNYTPLSHFFNFHSLSLSSNNFENFDNYRPGIFWIANDLLNTTQLKLGYEYDLEIEKDIYSAEISYQKYYPKFNFSYQNRGQIGYAKKQNTQDEYTKFDYREHVYSLEMQIPLSIYRGKTNYSYGFNVGTSYQKRYNLSLPTLKGFIDEIAFPLNYQIYFNSNSRRSQMDLVPKWGQNINVIYRHVPFENDLKGYLFAVRTNFYFPGFFTNHGFQARLSYQKNEGRYLGSYDIPMVSGYAHFDSPRVDNTLLLNYRFPIAYPDWTIGQLAYIKRFHGYVFADYQNIQDSNGQPISYGIGLSADFNMFKYVLPDFGIGAKLSYINHPSAKQKIVPSFSFNYSY
jgi:hypothetical protein